MLTLLKGAEQEEAIYLQHNIPLMLLEQLTEWYRAEIYTWKNCELVFDVNVPKTAYFSKRPINRAFKFLGWVKKNSTPPVI